MQALHPVLEKRINFLRIRYIYAAVYVIMILFSGLIRSGNLTDEKKACLKGVNMELREGNGEGIDSWKEVTLIYNAALKMITTKMEILNDEFQHVHRYKSEAKRS